MPGAAVASTLDGVTPDIPDILGTRGTAAASGPRSGSATCETARETNPRHQLRAYTHGNAVRLAAVLNDLIVSAFLSQPAAAPGSSPSRTPAPVARDRIAALWIQRWPAHRTGSGRNTVRSRIANAVGYLRGAGICAPSSGSTDITVTDHRLLAIAAGNLEFIVGDDGCDRAPEFWRQAIVVPDNLRDTADRLCAEALAQAAARSAEQPAVSRPTPTPRFQLRAYTQADPVRLASILLALGDRPVSRAKVREVWAQWWPRHAEATGSNRISRRMSRALLILAAAGIVHYDDTTVYIDDPGLLFTASANIEVVCDSSGFALPPSSWPRRPMVPPALQSLEDSLHDNMLRDQGAGKQAPTPGHPDPAADLLENAPI